MLVALNKYLQSTAISLPNVLSFYGQTFDDNQLRNPKLIDWQKKGFREIQYKNWHFAVIVQLDMFGYHTAIVQNCIHDKDYHNDNMQTEPFKLDSPTDKSHLVDWKKQKLQALIVETVKNCLIRK